MPSGRVVVGQERYPALDTLRAVAILLVLIFHASGDLPHVLRHFAAAAWCGVDLFFVLSGFLITTGLLAAKTSEAWYFRSFYWKRFLRIFPVYYGALLALLVLLPRFAQPPLPASADHKWYYFYLDNWPVVSNQVNPILGHFWSLAVEEQFYLVWPLVVFLLSRRALVIGASLVIVLAPLLRQGLLLYHINQELIYRNTFSRLDALMGGALCAALLQEPLLRSILQKRKGAAFSIALAFAVSPVLLWGPTYYHSGMLVFGISAYVLSFTIAVGSATVSGTWFNRMTWWPFRYLAAWSYGMYVYHLAVFWWIESVSGLRGYGRIFIKIVAVTALAGVSFELFEKRLMNYKHALSRPLRPGPVYTAELEDEVPSGAGGR